MASLTVVYAGKRPDAVAAAEKLREILPKHFEKWRVLSLSEFEQISQSPVDDVLMILGGDGTVLRATRHIKSPNVRVVGVNFGRAGFLCVIEPEELETAVKKLAAEDYHVEEIMRLSLYVDDKYVGDALNEIYVSSTRPGTVIEYRVQQREVLASDVADGVILSTPVGSTAYAFSSGGPIVDERLETVVVVPMASMTNLRPMVISIATPLQVSVVKGRAQALVDGHTVTPVEKGEVRVEKSLHSIHMISFDERPLFSRRLRKRLYGRP
ncbi:NAD+ kinase [Candidatus Caldarchaeum subterraneum]|uniref:NAD kinase n=1 Tax=Caldiarchaeum subterraneum TaxID=311458 RepID=E6N9E4_CALS0|nr:NAD+ kinase [Candidatus Caldarchaeum subterraneum]BAJ49778.1 NAD+ kinase [Candidatus Caldarchaeum subterraneum]BAJ51534.1 NAD+ kinase [Candidatus Caldarchaeum subterraneum]